MALIRCAVCQHEVSDTINICINCGCPIKKMPKILYVFLFVVLFLAFLSIFYFVTNLPTDDPF